MATAIFFHAHPDDECIATGGTMALAAAAGHRVVLVLATGGECGEPVEGVLAEGEALGDRRRAEVQRSAEILGAQRVAFLEYRDSGMIGEPTNDDPSCLWQAETVEAVGRLAAILNEESADVLTIYDDHGGYGHPDHIQVHRIGSKAAQVARTPAVFESTMNRDSIAAAMDTAIEAGFADQEMLDRRENLGDLFGSPERIITHAVDVTSVVAAKRSAMSAHASQIPPDAFFLAMPPEQFAAAFGTEWFIAHDPAVSTGEDGRDYADRSGEFVDSLFGPPLFEQTPAST